MSKSFITPLGRVSYPNLFKAKVDSFDSSKSYYSVDLIFPKSKDLKTCPLNSLRNEIEKAIKEKWPKRPPILTLPIKDGDGLKPQAGTPYDEAYHGCWFITLKNKRRPQVVDSQLRQITDETLIYGGCYGHASYQLYAYDNKGKKGISVSLNNFQKVRDGEPFGGGGTQAENEFEVQAEEADNPANYGSNGGLY